MEGDGGSKNNKKDVRRPMNAFLIFCKRQRSKVREKNPQMDNRSITRVLGDIWAKMDKEEKASFTHLAKQYKDAFMKANPGYKWHSSDRVHNSGGASGKASSKHGSGAANSTSTSTTGKLSNIAFSNKHQHYQDIRVSTEITPGKLADPGQMGGLNLLLKAGKESELMQSKSKPTVINPTSSFSSLFSFTPISIPPPTKPHLCRTSSSHTLLSPPSSLLASTPLSLSLSRPTMSPMVTNQNPVSSSSSLFEVPGVESTTTNSALLQLAEMCTTELYSSAEEQSAPSLVSQSPASVAPPKKRAKQWHNESVSPLADDNGRKHHHRSRPVGTSVVDVGKQVVGHDLPLDLSQANTKLIKKSNGRRQTRGMKGGVEGEKNSGQTWSRNRKRSSSATESVSSSPSPSISPIGMELVGRSRVAGDLSVGGMKSESHSQDARRDWEGLRADREFCHSSTFVSNQCSHDDSSKIASLLKAALPLSSQQVSSPSPRKHIDNVCCDSKYTKVEEVASCNAAPSSSVTVINTIPSVMLDQSHSRQQPFTQGKVKKKWTQRMMVEAQQELAKKESQQYSMALDPSSSLSTSQSPNCTSVSVSSDSHHQQMTGPQCSSNETNSNEKMSDSKPLRHHWGMVGTCKNPLLPPPPINTSFPLPVIGSGEAHRSHTLYKALTSEISPPRHRSVTVVTDLLKVSASSSKLHHSSIFDPITACGKKFTDHIVEQLVLHGSTNDRQDNVRLSHAPSSADLFPPSPSSAALTKHLEGTETTKHGIQDRKLSPSSKCEEGSIVTKPGVGIWASVPTHFPVDSDSKPVDWKAMDTEKKELDSSSFPASSLFEKVARKVCGPRRDAGSNQLNGLCPSSASTSERLDFSPSSPPQPRRPPCTDRAAEVKAALDICSAARRHQLNSMANGDIPRPCYPDRMLYEDGILQPVRKSRRANKGQKYQALIKEGIIQPSKERMAIRNASKAVQGLSSKEEIEHPTYDQMPELARIISSRERSTPSPKTVRSRASPIELFDFENSLVTFPTVPNLMSQPPQQRRRKKRFDRKVILSSVTTNVDCINSNAGSIAARIAMEDPASDAYVQNHRHGRLTFNPRDSNFAASLRLKPRMRGWCHTRVPLTEEELAFAYKSGSMKRKVRKIRTLHITHEADDGQLGDINPGLGAQPTVCPGITVPNDESTSVSPSPLKETVIESDGPCLNHTQPSQALPDQQSAVSVSPPSSRIYSSNIIDRWSSNKQGFADVMLSPLHLLTSAAMQSERAVFPTASAPVTGTESVSSSLPINSISQISPRPASTPFVEDIDQASRTKYLQSFGLGGVSAVQFTNSLSSSGLYSSQHESNLIQSSSSTSPVALLTQQVTSLESPSKRIASSALLSLSRTASSAFNISSSVACCRSQQVSVIQGPSVISLSSFPSPPGTTSTVPTPPPSSTSYIHHHSVLSSTGTQQRGLNSAPIPTLLNVPVISSPGAFSQQKNNARNVPTHKTSQHQHQMSQHRQSVMQHSQKLVKLLTTNQDETILFGDTRANTDAKRNVFGVNSQQEQGLSAKRGVPCQTNRIKAKKSTESLPIFQFHNKSAAAFVGNICTADSVDTKRPQSRRRPTPGSNVVKRKRQKPSLSQHLQQQQCPPSTQNSLSMVRGLSGSKLFPSSTHLSAHSSISSIHSTLTANSNVNTGRVTTAPAKKHKLTIWDHLSSQCPVPLKSAKTSKQQQSMQAMAAVTSSAMPVATAVALPQQQKTVSANRTTPTSQLIPFSMAPNSINNNNNKKNSSNGDDDVSGNRPSSILSASTFPAPGHEDNFRAGRFNGGSAGSDTDSANEDDDNEKVLCIVEGDHVVGSSDTDSAVESEFESATPAAISGDVSHNVLCSPAATTTPLVLNLGRATLPSGGIGCPHFSLSKSVGDSNINKNLTQSPHAVSARPMLQAPGQIARFPQSKSQVSGFGYNVYNPGTVRQSGSPSVVVVPPTAASPGVVPPTTDMLPSDAAKKNCESSFIPVSSITLPSDLPEGDQVILSASSISTASAGRESPRNILLAATVPVPSSSQVTVKTIAPTSPYPSPHVTDLSTSCIPASSTPAPIPATTTTVSTTSYGNILLSTLQNPHLVIVPHHQPPTNSTSSPLLSKVFLPLTSSSSVTASTVTATLSNFSIPTSISADATAPVEISTTVLKKSC